MAPKQPTLATEMDEDSAPACKAMRQDACAAGMDSLVPYELPLGIKCCSTPNQVRNLSISAPETHPSAFHNS